MLEFDLDRDELATRLGGGLPQGALCLVEGESGSGKSVLTQRLAYGLVHHGLDVVYVSTEFTTPGFLDQMSQLGYPIMEPFVEQRFYFASTTPLVGHPVAAKERLPRLLAARDLLTRDVVFVDVFSQLADPHLESGAAGEEILEHLTRTLKHVTATGTTLVLTIDPCHFDGVDESALTGSAEVRLQCAMERVGGKVNRFIVAKKFARAADTVGDVIPFRVEPGAGFIVEIKAVA